MKEVEILTLGMSAVALVISLRANRIAEEANRGNKKNALARSHQKYVDLLRDLQKGLEKPRRSLEKSAHTACDDIIKCLDRVGPRSPVSGRELRHIFVDVCDRLDREYDSELTYQTGANLQVQYYKIRDLECGDNVPDEVKELLAAIPETKRTALLMEAREYLANYWKEHDLVAGDLGKFQKQIEEALAQNELEEHHPLSDSPKLRSELVALKAQCDHLLHMNLPTVRGLDGPPIPYPISYLIYIGTVLTSVKRAWCWGKCD